MIVRTLGVLALSAARAAAFQDTSPFFLFSTAQLPFPQDFHVGTNDATLDALSQTLGRPADSREPYACHTSTFVVVSQPGVSDADFIGRQAAPHLGRWLRKEEEGVQSAISVADVVGEIDAEKVASSLESGCKASRTDIEASAGYITLNDSIPRVVTVKFPSLPLSAEERSAKLLEHDSFLSAVISAIDPQDYTVAFITSPPSQPVSMPQHPAQVYEMDDPYPSSLHTELRRDFSSHAANKTQADLPLFEKYQYLSPGLFMGIFVSLLLFSILYVAISAVAGLEVSYFAFSKEMSPQQQKKQQ